MDIIYTYDDAVIASEIFDLLDRMEQAKDEAFPAKDVFHIPLRNLQSEERSLEHSISVTARDSYGALQGYLRILGDNAYIYYILDVMVTPEKRLKHIGSELVNLAVEKCKEAGFIKIFLTAIPGSESFYERFGFKPGMSPVLCIRGEDCCEGMG